MKSVVLYARVSTREQEKEGYSIPAQIRLLEDYAKRNGLDITKQFVEAESAKVSGRSAFNDMVSFLKKSNTIKTILVEKTDRLYRNLKDHVIIDDLEVEIHLVKENEILSKESRSHAKFMHGIKVLMAKNYSDNLSEEVRKGITEKAKQGHFPSRAPYAYMNNRNTRMVDVDENEALFVRRAFELYATGHYSLQSVSEKLHEEGFIYKSNMPKIQRGAMEKILKNLFYTGDFMMKGVFYEGKHEALVSLELFEKVQRTLSRSTFKLQAKHDFAFSGLISCGHCGCTVSAQIQREKYIYYHCSGGKGYCPEKYLREEVLIEQFSHAVRRIRANKVVIDLVIKALKESHVDEVKFHDERIKALQSHQTALHRRMDMVYTDKIDGHISHAFWERKNTQFKKELTDTERKLSEHSKANYVYLESGVRLLEVIQNASFLYDRQQPHEQRRLLNLLLPNISLKDGNLCYDYNKPFDWIAENSDCIKWWAIGDSNNGPHPYQGCALTN